MSRKRRTEITIETERLVLISPSGRLWCTGCGAWQPMLTVDQAAALAEVSSRTIFRWVEAGRLHFAETPTGSLLICPCSLEDVH